MLELKVQDLRLRGRGFTLTPAAKENGIDDNNLVDFLITSIYTKLGLCSSDFEKVESIKKANPNILDTISIEDLEASVFFPRYTKQDLIDNGLVIQEGNNLVLTQKAIAIFKRAAEIQNELDSQNFHCCPCHHCC